MKQNRENENNQATTVFSYAATKQPCEGHKQKKKKKFIGKKDCQPTVVLLM